MYLLDSYVNKMTVSKEMVIVGEKQGKQHQAICFWPYCAEFTQENISINLLGQLNKTMQDTN